ncbi:Protein of unknown function (DUF1230) [Synechococcus sp. PCC 7502]|uniref:CGLD27 family protein n=1 Tax=Synechococcus sp. PCC 7502 TaxID=1173263 RepID=UPI00029FF2BD|nr:CGLD27 family protein [Synechococcus sp. PCC 7502]AFY73671.1 Protein of unknown function (DUF1230) [Synechococcus sp. PCC 7502]
MTNCPVPNEQQPLNEYLALKEAFVFRWATLNIGAYIRVLILIWAGWWIVSAPISAVSFSPSRHLPEFLCLGAIGATVGLFLPLVQMLLGWRYVKNRLQSTKVLYEESGWYDGQSWEKPESELLKDRLVVNYEVQPIVNKIKLTLVSTIALLGMQIAILQVLLY